MRSPTRTLWPFTVVPRVRSGEALETIWWERVKSQTNTQRSLWTCCSRSSQRSFTSAYSLPELGRCCSDGWFAVRQQMEEGTAWMRSVPEPGKLLRRWTWSDGSSLNGPTSGSLPQKLRTTLPTSPKYKSDYFWTEHFVLSYEQFTEGSGQQKAFKITVFIPTD